MAKTYKQMYEDHDKNDEARDLTTEYLTLEVGQSVIGMLVSVEKIQTEKIVEPVNRYVIDTDNGLCSVLLGNATDKQVEGKLHVGDLVYIEYRGKLSIQGGAKQVNRYIIRIVSANDLK